MRKYFLVRFNSVQSHSGGIYPLFRAGIRSAATVRPDVFKVLYVEKHTEILCNFVLPNSENGPLNGSTDRVRTLEERPCCCRHHPAATRLSLLQHANMYNRITSTKSPSVLMATFTSLMDLLHQLHDCICYVRRRILALPPLWLQKHTSLSAHDFAHSPDLWHHPTLAIVTSARSWRLLEWILLYLQLNSGTSRWNKSIKGCILIGLHLY
jgi:hypothetical protein